MASVLSSPFNGFNRYPPQHPGLMQPPQGYPEPLSPLDLSVKASAPITPPCTPSPPRKLPKRSEDNNNDVYSSNVDYSEVKNEEKSALEKARDDCSALLKTPDDQNQGRESPEIDVVEADDRPKKTFPKGGSGVKKNKAVRRLLFDEDKSSPVSGTIIRELADDETLVVRKVFCLLIIFETIRLLIQFRQFYDFRYAQFKRLVFGKKIVTVCQGKVF